MGFILSNKYHIGYVLLFFIVGVVLHLFKGEPKVVTKTVTKLVNQVQTVEKVVTKDRVVYVDRFITTKKPDGTVITEYSKEHTSDIFHSNIDSFITTKTEMSQKTTESYLSDFSIDVMYSVPKQDWSNPKPSWQSSQFLFGIRVLSLPLFVTVGSNSKLNEVLLGARLEF